MASARTRKRDLELTRLRTALRENERWMQEAAINYENFVTTKENLVAAIQARQEIQSGKTAVN